MEKKNIKRFLPKVDDKTPSTKIFSDINLLNHTDMPHIEDK